MVTTTDDLSRFIRETSKQGCAHCKIRDVSVLGTGKKNPNVAAEFILQPKDVEGSFRTFGAVCASCGLLTTFLAQTVEEWLKENPDESE